MDGRRKDAALEYTVSSQGSEASVPQDLDTGAEDGRSMEDQIEQLTEEEQRYAEAFAAKIDLTDKALILRYGAAGQRKAASFSDHILSGIHAEESEEMEERIMSLLKELKEFAPGEEKGMLGSGSVRSGRKREGIRRQYEEVQGNIDRIAGMMEQHQNRLLKEVIFLDKMYEANRKNDKEIAMYLLAGKIALEKGRRETLPYLEKQAADTGQMDAIQKAADFADTCHHLERRLHDLEISRAMSMQMGPQIRLIQGNHRMMSEKMQSMLQHTIPLWKSQVLLLLGLRHEAKAAELERRAGEAGRKFFQESNQEMRELLDEVLVLYQEERKEKEQIRTAGKHEKNSSSFGNDTFHT